jgi:hypothetical protein
MIDQLKFAHGFALKINIDVSFDISNQYTQAYYEPSSNVIFINQDAIKDNAVKWRLSEEVYLMIVLCHEFGHVLDKERNSEADRLCELYSLLEEGTATIEDEDSIWKIIKQRELNAWEIGRSFVPKELHQLYELNNIVNIEYRYCHTQMDIMKYKHNNEVTRLLQELISKSDELKEQDKKLFGLMKENYKLTTGKDDLDHLDIS